jgi:hypothetical protein
MQWVNRAKKPSNASRNISNRFVAYIPSSKAAASEETKAASSAIEDNERLEIHVSPSDDTLRQSCHDIFRHGFEALVGTSLGRYGCPFVYVRSG